MCKSVVHEFNMAPLENLLFHVCIVLEFVRLSKNYAFFFFKKSKKSSI